MIITDQIQGYLKEGAEAPFHDWRFKAYCRAGKLQCEYGLIEDAKKTYNLALENFSPFIDNFYNLLKLAKISTVIMQKATIELIKAEDKLSKERERLEKDPGFLAYRLASLAKIYLPINPEKGNLYLQEAIKLKDREEFSRSEKVLVNLKIAGAYKLANQPEKCLEAVKLSAQFVPFLQENEQGYWYSKLASLIDSIDKVYAEELFKLSEEKKGVDQ